MLMQKLFHKQLGAESGQHAHRSTPLTHAETHTPCNRNQGNTGGVQTLMCLIPYLVTLFWRA